MTVLVTGASGFIGAALCDDLRKAGMSVRAATRAIKSNNLANQIVEVGDISSETDWTIALKNVDQVVHLVARFDAIDIKNLDSVADIRRVNVDATKNFAEQAAASGVKRFVFISSVKVNGERTDFGRNFTADDVPAPEDAYGLTKYEAEQTIWEIASKTGMEVVVIRPPLVYGPGVKGNFFSLMRAIDKGVSLPLGAIKNNRSIIYLRNLTDVIRLCITEPKAVGRIFYVSDGENVSTPELVRRISSAMGCKSLLIPVPVMLIRCLGVIFSKQAATNRLLGSLTVCVNSTHNELGWSPPFTMQQGLEATAHWYHNTKEGGCFES